MRYYCVSEFRKSLEKVEGVLPRLEPAGLLTKHLRQTHVVHVPPKPSCSEHGRDAREDWVQVRTPRVGGRLGRPARHGRRGRRSDQGHGPAVPRLRSPARVRRPGLGLEPRGPVSSPRRGLSRELSAVEQSSEVSGAC